MKRVFILSVCLIAMACGAWSQGQDNQASSETVTISRDEFEALKAQVADLQQKIDTLIGQQAAPEQAPAPAPESATGTEAAPTAPETGAAAEGGGKALALPDISLIVQAKGKLSSDENDDERNRLLLSEAELGIQGYVYPNVKADAFITGSPGEDEPFQVEEAYLTYLGLLKGLSFHVGKKHVAFGRTNLLHSHSWPYTRQPLVITNFVAPESLSGQGASITYLIPTRSNLFAQLDLGTWSRGDEGEQSDLPDIVVGPGANLTDRFSTARLWTGYPVSEKGELELGGSWAGGKSNEDPDLGVDHVDLAGADLTYRHFGEANRRLLLRGEHFWRKGSLDSGGDTARGYYLFGSYRPDKYRGVGLLYDWSQFPQATNLHESALSLILTRQFSERYYLRLQAIHGSRPDDDSYNELWLQWVWGVGPHTHNLE